MEENRDIIPDGPTETGTTDEAAADAAADAAAPTGDDGIDKTPEAESTPEAELGHTDLFDPEPTPEQQAAVDTAVAGVICEVIQPAQSCAVNAQAITDAIKAGDIPNVAIKY